MSVSQNARERQVKEDMERYGMPPKNLRIKPLNANLNLIRTLVQLTRDGTCLHKKYSVDDGIKTNVSDLQLMA